MGRKPGREMGRVLCCAVLCWAGHGRALAAAGCRWGIARLETHPVFVAAAVVVVSGRLGSHVVRRERRCRGSSSAGVFGIGRATRGDGFRSETETRAFSILQVGRCSTPQSSGRGGPFKPVTASHRRHPPFQSRARRHLPHPAAAVPQPRPGPQDPLAHAYADALCVPAPARRWAESLRSAGGGWSGEVNADEADASRRWALAVAHSLSVDDCSECVLFFVLSCLSCST